MCLYPMVKGAVDMQLLTTDGYLRWVGFADGLDTLLGWHNTT